MGFNIKHLNKYFRWYKKHRNEYKDACIVSRELAKMNSDIDWALLLKKSDEVIDQLSMKKHEWILKYMESVCPETIAKYRGMEAPENLYEPNSEIKVWSMFWQGEENADKLFKMCIDSARRHTGHDVITLSEENYSKYFEIPEHILEKYEEGKIAVQHICDLMVMSIMAEEGGVFTGATVWWSQDKGEDFLRIPFYVPRAVTERKFLMSRSRWTGYFLAGNKEFPLFPFVRDCLHEYWKNCDKAVDYLMMDYLFELAYRIIPCVREYLDSMPEKNNMLRNELINDLATVYDEENFKKYTEGDTFLYKLSWKFGDKDEYTEDGKETNYAHMLKESNQ